MKNTLIPNLEYQHCFTIPASKIVRNLYPESELFQNFPEVFATGFMVGLMEWACIELLAPHLEDGEGSLGIHIDVSHEAATPPGMTVCVSTTLITIENRKLTFAVEAHDGQDMIGRGHHQRAVILLDRFNEKVAKKAACLP
ncbi:MAG: thioesterase family protein [Rhodospirillales bacterium]|nr:thioesterase family protein [Rhodospirillales bacterium]